MSKYKKYIDGTIEWAIEHLECSDVCDRAVEVIKRKLNTPLQDTVELDNSDIEEVLNEIDKYMSFDGTMILRQHIQSQAQEIERLKNETKLKSRVVNNLTDVITDFETKLNKIKEVVNDMRKNDIVHIDDWGQEFVFASTLEGEIKSILKEGNNE